MENQSKSLPIVFWIVAVIAVLWNLMGVGAFMSDMTKSAADFAEMTPELRALYENNPMYMKVLFALAVLGGLIGSIGLLMRKSWCIPLLLISLIAAILQMTLSVTMTQAVEVLGNTALIMPAVVILFAAFLFWYARYSKAQGIVN